MFLNFAINWEYGCNLRLTVTKVVFEFAEESDEAAIPMINSNKGCFWMCKPSSQHMGCLWLTVTKVVFESRRA